MLKVVKQALRGSAWLADTPCPPFLLLYLTRCRKSTARPPARTSCTVHNRTAALDPFLWLVWVPLLRRTRRPRRQGSREEASAAPSCPGPSVPGTQGGFETCQAGDAPERSTHCPSTAQTSQLCGQKFEALAMRGPRAQVTEWKATHPAVTAQNVICLPFRLGRWLDTFRLLAMREGSGESKAHRAL